MQSFICTTCGVGYAPSAAPPDHCPICVGWWDRVCERDAKERLRLSVERYGQRLAS